MIQTLNPIQNKLSKIIKESGLSFKESTNSFIFSCPKCHKSQKLYIRKCDGIWTCFYCKEINHYTGNKPENVLSDLLELPIDEIKHLLYGTIDNIKLSKFDEKEYIEEPIKLDEINWPPDSYPIDGKESYKGMKYINNRGISSSIAIEYGLRYWPIHRRVLFPIHYENKMVGWQARLITYNKWFDYKSRRLVEIPKIITSPGLKREYCVMFSHRIKNNHVVITEGPVDALKAHLCGGNIATLGKIVTKHQIQLLIKNNIKKIYIGLDPEAQTEIIKLSKSLQDIEIYLLYPALHNKDLGEMSMEKVYELFQKAPRIFPGKVIGRFM